MLLAIALSALSVCPQDGNRLVYLDESDPYYPHRKFAKLVTPQWVGEEGVEAVVVLAIDDMRGHEKWEAYLRPILERLKKIDGRAPVSIMTCTVDPNHPHLRKWLAEGVNIDVHTVDHPCPLLQGNDLAKAKSTVDRCADLLNLIPGNKPVAYRMPCCDSLNTPSPRFYAEIFNKTTRHGNFLTIDSSVFCVLTPNDPDLPKELTTDPDGKEKFRKYIPFPSFVNTIEDYPYPYVIGKLCWEFPCIVPSDWEAQHLNKPNSPVSVADMKAALDAVVLKQGVFNFVFHPHGWIKSDQVIELIDHAVEKHGKKVKFLNFREAQERLDRNLLAGNALRDDLGNGSDVRIVDLDNDGYLDVLGDGQFRIWDPKARSWTSRPCPPGLDAARSLRMGIVGRGGLPTAFLGGKAWTFDGKGWVEDPRFATTRHGLSFRLLDLDGDGRCEMISDTGIESASEGWTPLPFRLPEGVSVGLPQGIDPGCRFVDLNGDGRPDLVCSNDQRWGVHVFKSLAQGWEKVSAGIRGDPGEIPMIARKGTDNGAWFHSKHLWVQNEDTAKMPNLVDRRSFEDLLKPR
jgi:hypothetical protein